MTTKSESQTATYSTPTDLEFVLSREFDAPRRLLFEAYTRPEHIQRWMLGPAGWTMPICEVDLQPGGKWHFVWRREDGTEMGMTGVYREISPPERLVFTESWGDPWPQTVNRLVFTESDGRTTLTQTMLYPTKEARDAALKTGMKDGVERSFRLLDELLETLV